MSLAVVMGVGPPPPPEPVLPQSVQVKINQKLAKLDNRLPRLKTHWERKGYQVNTKTRPSTKCEAHSYGQVRDFFVAHRCEYMIRSYGEFLDTKGDAILVAFSWVEMPTQGEATRYLGLVDKGATGNVTELTRDTWKYRNVKFTGLGYKSDIQGRGVWNIQLEPVGRRLSNPLLREIRDEVLHAAVESVLS